MTTRKTDVLVAAGLFAAPYAVPRRLRPAAAMAGAIVLSRVHGAALRRAQDRGTETIEQLFDQRQSAHSRLDRLEDEIADISANRIGRIERIIVGQYGGRDLVTIARHLTSGP